MVRRVPNLIDLCATPHVDGVSTVPLAVRLPYSPGPYHEAVAVECALAFPTRKPKRKMNRAAMKIADPSGMVKYR